MSFITAVDNLLKEISNLHDELNGKIGGRVKLAPFSDNFIKIYVDTHREQTIRT